LPIEIEAVSVANDLGTVVHDVSNPLDNPAWHALKDLQARQGESSARAARFAPDISPIGALLEPTRDALEELFVLCGREPVVLLTPVRELPRSRFRTLRIVQVRQLCAESACDADDVHASLLGNDDAADMVALATLTEPGPFARRTVELGTYYGVRDGGRLLAMAGERLKLPGWVEVSGVCTHPDGRGRGYARRLVARITNAIIARGDAAFLHVAVGSPSETTATRVYEQLGYRFRHELYVHALMYDGKAP